MERHDSMPNVDLPGSLTLTPSPGMAPHDLEAETPEDHT